MPTKLRLLILGSIAALALGPAHATPALALQTGDVKSVELKLRPNQTPSLNVFFTNRKLLEAHQLFEKHPNEPIAISMNGTLVVTPRIKDPLVSKNRFLSLRFPDFDSATRAARLFIPTP